VLAPLDIKSGELCQISTADGDTGDGALKWWPAIAWLAADPHLQRHAALVSENVRELLCVGFEHRVIIRKYRNDIPEVINVVVREVPVEDGKTGAAAKTIPMKTSERRRWSYFLEHIFCRRPLCLALLAHAETAIVETKYVFEGLVPPAVEYKGKKRTFKVERITAENCTAKSPDEETSPTIPAYLMTPDSVVEIIPDTATSETPEAVSKENPAPIPVATTITKNASSGVTFASIGGLSSQIDDLRTILVSILDDSDEFSRKGLVPPRGVLLYGPPGTGKTLMLKAVASEINAKAFVLDGSIIGKYMGESEAAVRKIFAEARKNQPSIIFMDEVDSVAPKRSQGEGSEGRVVATLLTEMDGMESAAEDGTSMRVAVVAATNRPNSIDGALRRAGRFEKELEIGIPDVNARREILALLTKKLKFESSSGKSREEFVVALAGRTHGYVGADLEAVVRGGFTLALKRRRQAANENASTEKKEVVLCEGDFETALKDVKPTAMREIFIEPPTVRWSDIGGQEEVKQRLREAVEWPLTVNITLRYPFDHANISVASRGVCSAWWHPP
jgi:AAA family ATPase